MTTTEVISILQNRGVSLWQEGRKLKYRAPNGALTEREKAALKAHKASLIKALSQPTATTANAPLTPATAVTAPLPTYAESPELEPKDRLCYQCQHFQRSPYGFPLGLCRQHGMPEGYFSTVRGNRIQHAISQPTKFGCGTFEPKEGRS